MGTLLLAEREEIVLLAVAICSAEAYGAALVTEIEQLGYGLLSGPGCLYGTLHRLEAKGLLQSHMGGVKHRQGGRRRRLYTLTEAGIQVLSHIQQARHCMWNRLLSLPYRPSTDPPNLHQEVG